MILSFVIEEYLAREWTHAAQPARAKW